MLIEVPGKGVDQKEGTSPQWLEVTQSSLGPQRLFCVNSMWIDSQKVPLGPRSVTQFL